MAEIKNAFSGVNLGGWLVIEKWITPDLFAGTDAVDEYGLSQIHNAEKIIDEHRSTFITSADFKWLADNNMNNIRLPIGYWILEDKWPYLNGLKYLDFAFQQAKIHNLKILIDLHCLPGSQNGEQHSGMAGKTEWHLSEDNIKASLEFLTKICIRYGNNNALWSIELINEPSKDIPIPVLTDYYRRAINIINQHCKDALTPVVSDSFRHKKMVKALLEKNIKNVIIDMHFYQTYSFIDKLLGFRSSIWMVKFWKRKIRYAQKYYPVVVGEWSGGLGINKAKLKKFGKAEVTRNYLVAQQRAYSTSFGWFYWNYKVSTREQLNPWDLKTVIDKKLLKL